MLKFKKFFLSLKPSGRRGSENLMLISWQIIAIFLLSDLLWRLTDMVSVWDKLFSFVQDQGTNLSGTKAPAALFTPGGKLRKHTGWARHVCDVVGWPSLVLALIVCIQTECRSLNDLSLAREHANLSEMTSYAGGICSTECRDYNINSNSSRVKRGQFHHGYQLR